MGTYHTHHTNHTAVVWYNREGGTHVHTLASAFCWLTAAATAIRHVQYTYNPERAARRTEHTNINITHPERFLAPCVGEGTRPHYEYLLHPS